MPRSLGTEGLTESLAASLKAALLVWLDFSSGPVRLTNASSSMTWQGEHYVAVGSLGSVEAIAETSDLSASGVRMTLSGIDASLVAIALTESYQGRRGQLRLALLNDAMQVVDTLVLFDGKIDTMQITMGDTAQIVLTLEHRLIDAQRARTRRFTHEDQQLRDPGDRGLEYVVAVQNLDLRWGQADPQGSNSEGGGNPSGGLSDIQESGA
jgi:hypothetical protein